jgi:cobyrinic acid a,c-diamide synthase
VTGHEFHRTTVEFADPVQPAWLPSGEGAILDRVHASYLHTHPAGAPVAVRRFVELAAGAAAAGSLARSTLGR